MTQSRAIERNCRTRPPSRPVPIYLQSDRMHNICKIHRQSVHFGATNMPNTLYDILQVSPSANRDTIVDAYKGLHSKLAAHINGIDGTDPGTLDRMTALREAFSILADPERRRDYDRQLAKMRREGPASLDKTPPARLKSVLLIATISLFAVGYAQLLSELQTVRQEREQTKAEAMMFDIQLQRLREEQRLAAQADFQRRRDEAIERFIREQAGDEPQLIESGPPDKIRS